MWLATHKHLRQRSSFISLLTETSKGWSRQIMQLWIITRSDFNWHCFFWVEGVWWYWNKSNINMQHCAPPEWCPYMHFSKSNVSVSSIHSFSWTSIFMSFGKVVLEVFLLKNVIWQQLFLCDTVSDFSCRFN